MGKSTYQPKISVAKIKELMIEEVIAGRYTSAGKLEKALEERQASMKKTGKTKNTKSK